MVPVSSLPLWWTVDKQVAAVGPHTEAKARFPAVTEEKAACPQGLLQGLVPFSSPSSWVRLLLAASYWEEAQEVCILPVSALACLPSTRALF